MGVLITDYYDKKMLETGLESFSLKEKNEFILYLATKLDMLANEVTSDFLLNYYKDLKIQNFSNKCEDVILDGFTAKVNGHTYSTTREGQFNMFAKFVVIKDDPEITTVMYKAEDLGEQIPHTKEEFIRVVKEGFHHVEGTLLKLDSLRKQIRDCKTEAEVHAIKWDNVIEG